MASPATKLCEGYLEKKGKFFVTVWRRRYFVLLSNGLLLSCKKVEPESDSDKRVREGFKVKARLSQRSTVVRTAFGDTGWLTLQIREDEEDEPLDLRAVSSESQTRWLAAIQEAIESVPRPDRRDPTVDGATFFLTGRVGAEDASDRVSGDDDAADVEDHFAFHPYALPAADANGPPKETPRAGLTQVVRMKLQHALEQVIKQSATGYAIMVVDQPGMSALAGVTRTSELVNMGILTVEPLERMRQPLEGVDVIYLISPDYVAGAEDAHEDIGGETKEAGDADGRFGLKSPRAKSHRGSTTRPMRRGPAQLLTSLERMRKDFPSGRGVMRRQKPLYTKCGVHLLFVSRPENEQQASMRLAACSGLRAALVVRPKRESVSRASAAKRASSMVTVNNFQIFYLSSGFEIQGSHQFSFNMSRSLGPLLTRSAETLLPRVAKALAECCFSLNEFPYIRYSRASPTASSVAHHLADELEGLIRRDYDWRFHGQLDPGRRSTLLIMGRLEDFLPPLLHDFTLRCLVSDTLNKRIEDGVLLLKDSRDGGSKVTFPLTIQNTVWRQYRHRHIEDAVAMAQRRLKELAGFDSASVELRGRDPAKTGPVELTREQILNLGDYSEEKAKVGQLQAMLVQLFQRISDLNLLPKGEEAHLASADDGMTSCLTETEQILASGVNDNGNEVSYDAAARAVEGELIRCTEEGQRRQLLALAAISKYRLLQDRRMRARLFSTADLEDTRVEELLVVLDAVCADNRMLTEALGNDAFESSAVDDVRRAARESNDLRKLLSRYQSRIRRMAAATLEGKLPEEAFPFVQSPPDGFHIHDRVAEARSAQQNSGSKRVGASVRRREGEHSPSRANRPRVGGILGRMLQGGSENHVENIVAGTSEENMHTDELLRRRTSESTGRRAIGNRRDNPNADVGTMVMKGDAHEEHRLMVFVVGGLSHMEAEQLERLNEEYSGMVDVIAGGTSMLDARGLLEEALDSGVIDVYS